MSPLHYKVLVCHFSDATAAFLFRVWPTILNATFIICRAMNQCCSNARIYLRIWCILAICLVCISYKLNATLKRKWRTTETPFILWLTRHSQLIYISSIPLNQLSSVTTNNRMMKYWLDTGISYPFRRSLTAKANKHRPWAREYHNLKKSYCSRERSSMRYPFFLLRVKRCDFRAFGSHSFQLSAYR